MRKLLVSVAVPAFLAAVLVPETLRAADDTFSCLSDLPGPRVDLSGSHGYGNVKRPDWESDTVFDARRATWQHQTVPDRPEQNNWLALLGGSFDAQPQPRACWAGGLFTGTNRPNEQWVKVKKQGGRAVTLNSNNGVIDGVRIDNIGEDGIAMIHGSNWTIKDSWISRVFDDCIENDHLRSGQILDSLLEGCYMGLSIDPGKHYHGPSQEREVVTLNGVLMSLRRADMTNRPTYDPYGIWFKTHSASPSLKIYNSLLAFDGFVSARGRVARLQRAWDRTVDCKDNVIAWLSDAPFPANFPTPPSCFRIVQGQEARHLWSMSRTNWINCHPNLARSANDPESDFANPESDFSKCDPNAYGGGDGVTTPRPQPSQPLAHLSKRAVVVPVVDGNLEEFRNAPSTALGDHTLQALWEADALYVAANIADDRLDVSISTRDGELWTEDSLEVFIDPERDRGRRMTGGDRQFVVNARGTQLDTAGTAWDGEWRTAVRPTATGYAVELGIPWRTLGLDPVAGASYGFSFAVNDKDGDSRRCCGAAPTAASASPTIGARSRSAPTRCRSGSPLPATPRRT